MFYNAVRSAVIILTRLQSKAQYKCSNISVNSPWKIFLLRNLSQKLDHFGRITLHNLIKTSWSHNAILHSWCSFILSCSMTKHCRKSSHSRTNENLWIIWRKIIEVVYATYAVAKRKYCTWLPYTTAVIFLQIILHSAVHINDFHIFIIWKSLSYSDPGGTLE